MNGFELKDKVFIVTGASFGIGRALCLELAAEGARLVLNARSQGPLQDVARECEALGAGTRFVAGPAGDSAVAGELVSRAVDLGDFFGFLHAAGVLHPGPFLWELSQEQFSETFESHVLGAYQLIRHAVPHLAEKGRGIAVFFGSGAVDHHTPGMGAYSAAKAAEEYMALQLAAEIPVITSFVYRPGVVETRMQKQSRNATGGGGEVVRTRFRGYRDRGELIAPETAARSLVKILSTRPERFTGEIVTWREGVV